MYNSVKEFHEKYGFPVDILLDNSGSYSVECYLQSLSAYLKAWSKGLESSAKRYQDEGDSRLYRIIGVAEEVGELAEALIHKDKFKTIDACYDAIYFLIGTLVTFKFTENEFPFQKLFDAVHLSNMSKTQGDVCSEETRRNKSEQYCPPNFKEVLDG